MYKIIVSDLDDTLLDNTNKIPEKNIEAIKKASELGIKFVPASGRGYREIKTVLKKLDLYDKDEQYVISFNGGAITQNKDDRIIKFNNLPFEEAAKLFEFGLQEGITIHLHTPQTMFIYKLDETEKERLSRYGDMHVTEFKEKSIRSLKDKNIPIVKMMFVNADRNYLESIKNEIELLTKGSVNINFSPGCMEFNTYGIDKGAALLSLTEFLDVKPEETIVVGDSHNDLSMLAVAGLSVAAGNAVDDVKKACSYICKNTNNEGVLAEVIEKFILN